MNLLPKSHKEFSSKEYWDSFFDNRGSKPFEWYGEYIELCDILHKYIRTKDNILIAGCGNSTLGVDLYKAGYKNIINVDISEVVIQQMVQKYCSDFPGIKWIKADLLAMDFGDGSFTCVVDKGTLDAMMSGTASDTEDSATAYFEELNRILAVGGRYICISLLQEHILSHLLKWFTGNNWIVRVCRCKNDENSNTAFPVFLVICTKFVLQPGSECILESHLGPEIKRVNSLNKIVDEVKSVQNYASVCYNLNRKYVMGENISLELWHSESNELRFILHVVDAPKKNKTFKYAAFIVPHGRDHEWLFSTSPGRLKLAESAGAVRLIVVHLMRNQDYTSLAAVQDELSKTIMQLAPPNLPPNIKVPFLSVGNDLGSRTEKFRCTSKLSGEMFVEDVTLESGESLRRLYFLSNLNIIQSEAKLISVKRRKKAKVEVDPSYLCCSHHVAMIEAMALLPLHASILLIGVGGGSVASFMHAFFPLQLI